MAAAVDFGGSDTDRVFLGTDLTKAFHVLDYDTDTTGATAKDITGWAITFLARKTDDSSAALLTKTLTIAGTFNATATLNAQRATVTLADTDLTAAVFGPRGGRYRYSVKRTTDGSETILAYGDFIVERATQV